jgi:hypothetical protein
MTKVHKRAYERFYAELSSYFIDCYCGARNDDYSSEESFFIAKIKMQEKVILELTKNRPKVTALVSAYLDLKEDHELYEKTLNFFHGFNFG